PHRFYLNPHLSFPVVLVFLIAFSSFFLTIHPPPPSPLFPYTTLFRSHGPRLRRRRSGARLDGSRGNATPRRRHPLGAPHYGTLRSEEHTSELQSHLNLVCRLLLEKKKNDDDAQDRSRCTSRRRVRTAS